MCPLFLLKLPPPFSFLRRDKLKGQRGNNVVKGEDADEEDEEDVEEDEEEEGEDEDDSDILDLFKEEEVEPTTLELMQQLK